MAPASYAAAPHTSARRKVKIIRKVDTDDEEVEDVEAHIQAEKGFFDVDTPTFEGDLVEVADPRRPEGAERRLAAKVKVNNIGPPHMQYIAVTWGPQRHPGPHR